MMDDYGTIVIVDDDWNEGMRVARAIWKAGLPALFAHYETTEWSGPKCRYGSMTGVRVVFMDIDLLAGGMKGSNSQLFGVVQTALETLIDKKNGPYVLVTWTSFGEHAEELREYLEERLALELRPFYSRCLQKDEFVEDVDSLAEAIQSLFSGATAFQTVATWERGVHRAAAWLAADLANTARGLCSSAGRCDDVLAVLLFRLARAKAGRAFDAANFSPDLYSMLIPLLADELAHTTSDEPKLKEPKTKLDADDWPMRVNTMLHFDTNAAATLGPGLIVDYPEDGVFETLPFRGDATSLSEFIKREMLVGGDRLKVDLDEFGSTARPILMDVTPPCDHAQRKVKWRRFVVGVVIPVRWEEYVYFKGRGVPVEVSRKGDYLWMSPKMFVDGQAVLFIFNGRLVASLADAVCGKDLERMVVRGRFREQLFGNFLGWLGSHITRNGIFEVRE